MDEGLEEEVTRDDSSWNMRLMQNLAYIEERFGSNFEDAMFMAAQILDDPYQEEADEDSLDDGWNFLRFVESVMFSYPDVVELRTIMAKIEKAEERFGHEYRVSGGNTSSRAQEADWVPS